MLTLYRLRGQSTRGVKTDIKQQTFRVANFPSARICEIYIDDVLLFGTTDNEYLGNTRKVLVRLREKKVTANPDKTRLGLKEVEYVGHLISSTGTSFTEEKRLQVLDFPLPETEKALLQFIGLVNYFRDHVPKMTEMVQPLRFHSRMHLFEGLGLPYPRGNRALGSSRWPADSTRTLRWPLGSMRAFPSPCRPISFRSGWTISFMRGTRSLK